MSPERLSEQAPQADESLQSAVDEAVWMDVIQKMDEVYSQLIDDEVELEKKNAELEQSQQFVFSVISAMSDVLVVCDAHGHIEQTNAALNDLVGRDEAALRGTSFVDLLADADSVERVRQVLVQTRAQRSGQVLELQLLDASGASVPVDANCTPRIDHNGRHAGTVLVGRPTAELKRAYQELRSAHDALKRAQQQLIHSEKMASLGRLVAGVAHELNNPISFVLGNVHALDRYMQRLSTYLDAVHAHAPPESLEALRKKLRIDHMLADLPSLIEGTMEGAQRTTDIVNGLKRFSAMDPDARASVDLAEIAERAIHWIRKGVTTAFELHWDERMPCQVSGSGGQLQQVMMNLLQNALDAVSLTGRTPELHVSIGRTATHAIFTLRDNGPGISEAHLSRIFDPFFTTKPVGKGTGLGLSISYGIVEQHGGTLSARNVEQGGAEFLVQLPLAQDAQPSPPTSL